MKKTDTEPTLGGMRVLASASPARGVLSRAEGREHRRVLPCAELAPYVAHFWWVEWDLVKPFVAETLPHPTVHLIFETPGARAAVHGVTTKRFTRTLRGRGRVFGVKLRPGGLRGLVRVAVERFTDHIVAIGDVFGPDGAALGRELAHASDMPQAIATVEAFLRERVTPLPPDIAAIRDLVERIERDRNIRRTHDATRIIGCDERALQRRFKAWVGVGPKWVIQRYRLMEAVEQLKKSPIVLANLAAELGYADQAHFSRDFAAIIGQTPRAYMTHARGLDAATSPIERPDSDVERGREWHPRDRRNRQRRAR